MLLDDLMDVMFFFFRLMILPYLVVLFLRDSDGLCGLLWMMDHILDYDVFSFIWQWVKLPCTLFVHIKIVGIYVCPSPTMVLVDTAPYPFVFCASPKIWWSDFP